MKRSLAVLAVLLAGCGGGAGTMSEPPVSQQTTTTDARQRAKVHTELGGLYLENGRYGVAQDEARIAIDADSSYAPAYNLLALVHMNLREDSAAEAEFRKALNYAPNDPEINNNYGWFLCQTDRVKQSINHFLTAIKNPFYATPGKAMAALGICYLRIQEDASGEDFLLKALRVDPAGIEARYVLADLYYRKGRFFEARRLLTELHKLIDPSPQSTWLALRVERRIGDREAEARYASQMRRRFQGSAEYQKFIQGQYE